MVVRLVDDWSRISAPVYGARAARILHFAAAALAAGVLAGLYLHGIALEYRASWELTFLMPRVCTGCSKSRWHRARRSPAFPSRRPGDRGDPRASGENAARWLHLMAATVALLVIVPRLLLALFAWLVERHRSTHLPLALDEPYFQRLLRGFRGGPARVYILPYSYTLPPAVTAGLERLVARAFGGSAAITTAAPVTYGGEDALATAGGHSKAPSSPCSTRRPRRNAKLTAPFSPIAGPRERSGTVVALVDESAFRARLGTEPARLEERRQAWRELCADRHVPCAFADLLAADVTEAQAALERALEETAEAERFRNAIALSLISHTNAGKTTLARTLLGRDVGEVRDAAHVTTQATPHTLMDTPEGDALVLWDTPGFGDSARLARRLAQQGNPIGWFLSQVWDRFRDRPFYLSQQAVRNVRDEGDIVLYLVNASEAPADAGYLAPELDVLGWIGRPVFVLLNQTGRPRPRGEEETEASRWRDALGNRPFIHGVLTLDAFARCWVQEIVLLRAIAPAVAAAKRAAYERLVAAWQARRNAQFEEAIAALAAPIARAAKDEETISNAGLMDTLREALRSVVAGPKENDDKQRAARALADRLDAALRESTARLIEIHGLEGRAADEVLERLAERVRTDAPMHEGTAAMMGGVLSGALSGLVADLAAGGLTLGPER